MFRRLVPDFFIFTLLVTLVLATLLPVQGVGAIGVNWLVTAAILLPIMIFHQLQLMARAWIARCYAKGASDVQ